MEEEVATNGTGNSNEFRYAGVIQLGFEEKQKAYTDIRGLELDWSQLNADASTLATRPVSKSRSPQSQANSDSSSSSKNNANGSSAISVKQPLSPFRDTRIGET